MRISIIAAVAENGVIGRSGALPWRLSSDLQRFKQLTMGHTVIMGRRTWESIGRALPGRRMVVVSRQPGYRVGIEEVRVAASIKDALDIAEAAGEEEAFIIGGAELYREAFPMADRLYLTIVMADVEGDTFFPLKVDEFEWDSWVCLENETHEADAQNDYPFMYSVFHRCEPRAETV